MVSGFVCKCHGFMSWNDSRSFQLFEAGVNREGWFTNDDLVKQFKSLTELFQHYHPNCEITIGFDNSMTHRARPHDGLDVTKLKLSDGFKSGITQPMRNGWYMKDGVKVIQSMQIPETGVQKGIRSILTERGIFINEKGRDLVLLCKHCTPKTRDRTEEERQILWDSGER